MILRLLLILVFELLVFKGAWMLTQNWARPNRFIMAAIYWAITITTVTGFITTMARFGELRTHSPGVINFWLGSFFTLFVPKAIFLLFHLGGDVVHAVRWLIHQAKPPREVAEAASGSGITRKTFLTQAGLITGGLTFGAFLHGVTIGKFKYRVIKQDITSKKIGSGLNGLKIVQISDLHLGSFFDDTAPAERAVDMINALEPDYVFFTGDMVNQVADEAEAFIETFNRVAAKHGKFSVFGNHDYAHYGRRSREEEEASVKRLKEIHAEMGFRLLEDEHVVVNHGGEEMEIIGVHNIGRGFHTAGDLQKATAGSNAERFQVLLSHDPTHFEDEVSQDSNIDLTLSGHTHGLQMGIEIPAIGLKFSPVQFVYKHWAGLYRKGEQQIYVNRGFGFLAFPGRVGIFPEITLLTLKAKQS